MIIRLTLLHQRTVEMSNLRSYLIFCDCEFSACGANFHEDRVTLSPKCGAPILETQNGPVTIAQVSGATILGSVSA